MQAKRNELVLIFLSKPRCKSKHQLHAFELIHPIGKRGFEFLFLGRDDARWANRSKLAEGQGAITVYRAITSSRAPFIILREKNNNGHAIAAVDAQFWNQFAVSWSLDETQINLFKIGFGDSVNQRTLFNAIATPDAAEDQDFHFPYKAANKQLLAFAKMGGIVDLAPATLLFVSPRLDVAVVWNTGGKLVDEVRCLHFL